MEPLKPNLQQLILKRTRNLTLTKTCLIIYEYFNINSQYSLHLVFSSMNVRVFYLKISLTDPNHIRVTFAHSFSLFKRNIIIRPRKVLFEIKEYVDYKIILNLAVRNIRLKRWNTIRNAIYNGAIFRLCLFAQSGVILKYSSKTYKKKRNRL